MFGLRCGTLEARSLVLVASLGLSGCTSFMTSMGGGLTEELQLKGVPAVAEILEIWETGWTINDSPVIGMKVRVQAPDRPEFEAVIEKTTISVLAIPQVQPGNLIPVRFDPDNPSIIAVDPEGSSQSAAVPSSGNPYRDRFERPDLEGAVFLPPPAEPRLYLGTGDMETDFQTLFANDYALMGGSGVSHAPNPQLALEQGQEIGAALVVVYGHYVPDSDQALEVLPFARPAASARPAIATDPRTMRMVTGRLGPDDQFATYWGRTRPPILGIVSRPLDAQEQARLHRQDGIVVETVSHNSPAAAAGIAVGDVIVAIDGQPLPDPRAVPERITSLAGRQVQFDLIRDGSPLSMSVQLAAASP